MNLSSKLIFSITSVLLLACVGCQQRAASKLQGRWEGQPDTAAARTAREAEKYGDEQPTDVATELQTPAADNEVVGGEAASSKIGDSESDEIDQITDWEGYDVTIVMDFVSSDRLKMSLDGEQPIEGNWKVISTTPSGCSIEVLTKSNDADSAGSEERRRFDLLLDEREGTCVGFLLTEAGADAQLGAIYFRRAKGSSTSQ